MVAMILISHTLCPHVCPPAPRRWLSGCAPTRIIKPIHIENLEELTASNRAVAVLHAVDVEKEGLLADTVAVTVWASMLMALDPNKSKQPLEMTSSFSDPAR